MMKTFSANNETIKRDWFIVDATDKVLGRLASEVAKRLKGKHKAEYTPHIDSGDFIIIVNADRVRITGNKETDKVYYHHSQYPGGLKSIPYQEMMVKHPTRALEKAIKGMLSKNSLGRQQFRKLRVYAGSEHGHEAQQPKQLEI